MNVMGSSIAAPAANAADGCVVCPWVSPDELRLTNLYNK